MPALMRRVVNQPTLRMNDLAVAKTDRLLSQPLLASQTKSISRRTQHQIAITKPQFQSDPSTFQSPSSFPNTTKPSQLLLPQPLHQLLPHNTQIPIIRTNLFPLQLLIDRPRGPVGVLAQLVDAQKTLLDVVVFGVLLVAPVAGERQPTCGIPGGSEERIG
jgi:hypothetical protein